MIDTTPHGQPVASHAQLRAQAAELRLHGLLAHWDELMGQPETEQRVRQWLGWESVERAHRSLERRLREAHLCLLYTSPSPRDRQKTRMPSSA